MSKIAYWYCPNCHEEVDSSRVTWQELHDVCGHHVEWIEGISIDRLRKICEAERDGRLVVLPCKVGTSVYTVEYEFCNMNPDWSYYDVLKKKFNLEMIYQWGKDIFPSRKEAEKEIARRKAKSRFKRKEKKP